MESYFLLTKILNIFEGVPLFFVLSGFLIWRSIGHTNTLKEFVKKGCKVIPRTNFRCFAKFDNNVTV